jgi:hypothetical protein
VVADAFIHAIGFALAITGMISLISAVQHVARWCDQVAATAL